MAAGPPPGGPAPGAGAAAAHAAVLAAIGGLGDGAADRMAQLRQDQRALVAQRKRLAADLKKEQLKKARLVEKAKQLSDADLISILASRAQAKAKAKAQPKGKAKAKAKAAGAG